MGDLANTNPTTRSLTIMAAIERGEGSPDKVVRGWLTRALDASRGPQWVCTSCSTIHKSWEPVCEYCAHFDTLNWQVPPKSTETAQHSTDMLPLIVGAVEDKTGTEPIEPPNLGDAVEPPENITRTVPKPTPPPDTPIAAPAANELSEDLDGIVGDIHTVPGQPDKAS